MDMSKEVPEQPIYLINFEDYLRPKKPQHLTALQCFEKPPKQQSKCYKIYKRLKLHRWLREFHGKISLSLNQIPLPKFLNFLRERNDDGLCKPKTGFEIYCEMSSIHGFHLFVGAKTWQRVLWWLFICLAVLLSLLVLIMSYGLSADTPTIRYIESMMHHDQELEIPFPGITICDLNRVSKSRLQERSKEWQVDAKVLQQLPWLNNPHRLGSIDDSQLGGLMALNLSWSEVMEQLAPESCERQLLACKWQGRRKSCHKLFVPIWSYSEGRCCRFQPQPKLPRSTKGLTIQLATNLQDYGSTSTVTAGFQVLFHEVGTEVNAATQRVLLPRGTESQLMVKPFGTHATSYVSSLDISKRGCYISNERRLLHFTNYSQDNCLAECAIGRIYKQCGCVPPHMPSNWQWSRCTLKQLNCLRTQDLSWRHLQQDCHCLPSCQFHRYEVRSDVANLDAGYTQTNPNDYFVHNLNSSDELLIHIYFESLSAEQLRLDVFENWLTFIGTFGGITGLFMGCSFVSVFELIFFVCVRPTCNWLLRQRVRYRLRQRRRRQVAQTATGN